MRWTGGRRSGPESPAIGGVPPQVGARRAPATVEVPPPADDISSAAHSRVAQLVEQPAVNRRVAGSSPASGASQLSAPQSLSDGPFGPSGALLRLREREPERLRAVHTGLLAAALLGRPGRVEHPRAAFAVALTPPPRRE